MALTAEWRASGDAEAVLIVNDVDNSVCAALTADATVLSKLLTDMGELDAWKSGHPVDGGNRDPEAWGHLIIARASTGEVINMDPERFWDGIYHWFRSRGVDYDTPGQ